MKRSAHLLWVMLIAGCAAQPTYVSTSNYAGFGCTELRNELARVDEHLTKLKGFSLSSTGVGVGVVAGSWGVSPQISVGMGSGSKKQAKSRLLGEREAILKMATTKNCVMPTKAE